MSGFYEVWLYTFDGAKQTCGHRHPTREDAWACSRSFDPEEPFEVIWTDGDEFLIDRTPREGEDEEQYLTEERLVDEQAQLIRDKYGDRAAETANYGWGASDRHRETKVYVSPQMILISEVQDDGTIRHRWRRYDDKPTWAREADALLHMAQVARPVTRRRRRR